MHFIYEFELRNNMSIEFVNFWQRVKMLEK